MTVTSSRERRVGWVLLALTALLGIVRLGAGDVLDPHEARAVGVAQDVLRGRWLWPVFNDGMIPPEPPGFHALVAAAIRLAGFSELVVRLPGAAAWVALVWLTVTFGRALGASRVGLVAGLLLAATPGLAAAARTAQPDALFATATTGAMLFVWRWLQDGRRRDATTALGVATLATLIGGPAALALVGGVLAWTLAWRGEIGRLRQALTPMGLAIVVVVAGGWYAGGWLQGGDAFAARHFGGLRLAHLVRAFAWEDPWSARSLLHHLAFHPIGLLRLTVPWLPLAAVALWGLRDRRARRDPRLHFLVTWAAVPLIVFLWSAEKAHSDLLASLPPLALLAGHTALDLSRRWPRPLVVGPRAMALPGIVTLLALAVVTTAIQYPGFLARADRNWVEGLALACPGGSATLVALAAVAGGLAAGVVAARAWPLAMPLLAAAGLLWNLLAQPTIEHGESQLGSLRPFAQEVARVVRRDEPLVFFARTERPIVVYLDRVVPSVRRDVAALPTGAFVILRARFYDGLHAAGRLSPILLQGSGRMHDGRPGHLVLARVLAPLPPRPGSAPRREDPGWSAAVDPL